MKKDKELEYALTMLKSSLSTLSNVYNVNAFATNDISITAQRRRAINLSWALVRSGKVKDGCTIAIIGGGFTGTVLATSLSLLCKCVVVIIERRNTLLGEFDNAKHRFVGYGLNASGLINAENQYSKDKFPIFQWNDCKISELKSYWLSEYKKYCRHYPVIEMLSTECIGIKESDDGGVSLSLKSICDSGPPYPGFSVNTNQVNVDISILATGFGAEKNILNIKDYSYWKSGSELQYTPARTKETVLISGGGDSGLIEVLHYALHDFNHEDINNYNNFINKHEVMSIEGYLQQLEIGRVGFSFSKGPVDSVFAGNISPPSLVLKWYVEEKVRLYDNLGRCSLDGFSDEYQSLFHLLDKFIQSRHAIEDPLEEYENTLYLEFVNSEEFSESISSISTLLINSIKERDLDCVFEMVMKNHQHTLESFKKRISNDFRITWNIGREGVYSKSISAPNYIVTHLLKKYASVNFDFRKLDEFASPVLTENGWLISFQDGTNEHFNRVATRHGPLLDTLAQEFNPQHPESITEPNEILASSHDIFIYGEPPLYSDDLISRLNSGIDKYFDAFVYSAYLSGDEKKFSPYSNNNHFSWVNEILGDAIASDSKKTFKKIKNLLSNRLVYLINHQDLKCFLKIAEAHVKSKKEEACKVFGKLSGF